jgi:hypothetical protein
MKPKKPRYKGELGKPIYVGSIPFEAANEVQQERIEQGIEQAAIKKLPLLMDHYDIKDKDDYLSLALALAADHVPGFQVKRATLKLKHGTWGAVIRDNIGRPAVWRPERLLKLLNDVEEAKQRHECPTDREAIRRVVRQNREEWGPPANHRTDEKEWLETLESRLQDAKRLKQGGSRTPRSHSSDAIVRELDEEAVRLATAEASAIVYATLPIELRFAALCLPFSIEQNSGNSTAI